MTTHTSDLQTGELLFTQSLGKSAQENIHASLFLMQCYTRHRNLDFGDICDEDKRLNEDALSSGGRIMSSYEIPNKLKKHCRDEKIWIITEAKNHEGKRLCTTILYPSEY